MSTEFEDDLRGMMRVAGARAPAPAGLSDRLIGNIVAARRVARRPARRRYLPAVAAAAVVVVTVGIAVTVSRTSSRHPGAPIVAGTVVPWSAQGVTSVATTDAGVVRGLDQPIRVDAPADTRDCVEGDFALVSAQSAAGADGWVTTNFVLRSIATTNCAVSIRPFGYAATLTDAGGHALPNNAPAGAGPYVPDLLVRPGQLASGGARWTWDGHSTARPAHLVILPGTDPGAARLAIPLATISIPRTTLTIDIGVYAEFASVADPESLGSLDATVDAPTRITLGTVANYTVDLRNPTDVPVSLAACPDVVQVIAVVPVKQTVAVGVRAPLNCAHAPAVIEPGASVTFAFEINSTGLVTGTGRLTWSLATGAQTVLTANAAIEISP